MAVVSDGEKSSMAVSVCCWMVLQESERRLKSMLHWDVNNGIARRAWARNEEALFAIRRAMEMEPKLVVTIPNEVDDQLMNF
jgi:urocanate hydratase